MKQAIVLASFGVADERARRSSLDALADAFSAAYPDYELRQAYTSAFLRRRLEQRGTPVPSLAECLEDLADRGYGRVFVQPSHLTPGEEYDGKVLAVVEKLRGRFSELMTGEPLFSCRTGEREDSGIHSLAVILAVLAPGEDEELVLLGHGSPHRHNPVYEVLQEQADCQGRHIHIGVLEESDWPNFSMVHARLQKSGRRKLLLAPLLLSCGIHVMEDLAGTSPQSWKNRLRSEGFSVRTVLKGLGEYPEIRRLYLRKAAALLQAPK